MVFYCNVSCLYRRTVVGPVVKFSYYTTSKNCVVLTVTVNTVK